MIKKTTLFMSFVMSFALMACEPPKTTVNVQGPKPGGGSSEPDGLGQGQKPSNDIPPYFLPEQFQRGQWIQWAKKSENQHIECERWTVVEVEASGYLVKVISQYSNDCKKWSPSKVGYLYFNPQTGDVEKNSIVIDNAVTDVVVENFNNTWYGSRSRVSYEQGNWKIQNAAYPAFQLRDQKSIYFYSLKSHPFRAIALAFEQKNKNGKWKYQYHSSDPELPNQIDQDQKD